MVRLNAVVITDGIFIVRGMKKKKLLEVFLF